MNKTRLMAIAAMFMMMVGGGVAEYDAKRN